VNDETPATDRGSANTNYAAAQSTHWQRPGIGRAWQIADERAANQALPSVTRRRAASRRLPRMGCGHRDPLDCLHASTPSMAGYARYGLTIDQARSHGNALVTTFGWNIDEVVAVLGINPKAAA
jgi:hypothetical protein